MVTAWHLFLQLLGIGLRPEQLSFAQVALRALIIFLVALALMRCGHKCSLARKTAFDTTFVVIFGAITARAINDSGPFFPTIIGATVLVFLHSLRSTFAEHSENFEVLIKGQPAVLLRNGDVITEQIRARNNSPRDLAEDMYLRGHRATEEIELARLERSGAISFIRRRANREARS